MILPRLNDQQVFSALRVTCGLHFLLLQLLIQLPNFNTFYSAQGMVDPYLFEFYRQSPLFFIWPWDGLKFFLFIVTILLSGFFALGLWARIVHLPLFFLTLSFQMANPMVIHEPQQLLQLLLFVLWFVPYENHYCIKRSMGFDSYEYLREKWGRKCVYVIQGFLAYYYLLAGIKKLPDPLWRSGEAVGVLLKSPYLGRSHFLVDWLTQSSLTRMATYSVLAFELLFITLVFTRHRVYLFWMGVMFHLSIFIFMDVGLFWAAMLMWYPVLLFKKDAKKPSGL